LAAADAPLTVDELAAVINQAGRTYEYSDIETTWRSPLGRTVTPSPTGHGLVFSHDTLRDSARDKLAGDLPARRGVLHAWADRYADDGWPDGTPRTCCTGIRGCLPFEPAPTRTR
jgi:hypothetical protein